MTAKAKKFPGVKIETKILDNNSLEVIDHVEPGEAYGHSIEIGKFNALWPLPLSIKSTLGDTQQLAFRQSGTSGADAFSWDWELTLYPNRIGGEGKRLLLCVSPKVRNIDKITVKVQGDDREEDLLLKVPIE
jgi:hypothetical protein